MFVIMVLTSEKFGSIYKNADFDNLLITNTDWNELILGASDIDRAAENFSNTFLTQIKECIPEKSVVIRP